MKRLTGVILLVLLMGVCVCALGAPAITDDTVTAWIGEQNLLYLQTESGLVRRMSIPMDEPGRKITLGA